MRDGLTGALRRQLDAMLQHLRKARKAQPRAVHQGRVATRRLREAVPVAVAAVQAPKRQDPGREIRAITRALGGVRELDVSMHVLDEDARRCAWDAAAVGRVRDRLTRERARRVRAMRTALDRIEATHVEARVRALISACEADPRAPWRTHLSVRLRKRSGCLAEALRAVGTMYAPEPLHKVRIAAKKLRYTLDLAKSSTGARVGRDVATLKRLQDLLGHLRDLQVLQEHIRAVSAAHARNLRLKGALDDMQRGIEAECRGLHARFLGRVRRLAALAERTGRLAPSMLFSQRAGRMLKVGSLTAERAVRAASA